MKQSSSPNKYLRVSEGGYVFVFKYDADDPSQLHIVVRHLTTIDDALDAFFDGEKIWNIQRQRFESRTDQILLYWYWIDESQKVVMVVSCINLSGGSYSLGV